MEVHRNKQNRQWEENNGEYFEKKEKKILQIMITNRKFLTAWITKEHWALWWCYELSWYSGTHCALDSQNPSGYFSLYCGTCGFTFQTRSWKRITAHWKLLAWDTQLAFYSTLLFRFVSANVFALSFAIYDILYVFHTRKFFLSQSTVPLFSFHWRYSLFLLTYNAICYCDFIYFFSFTMLKNHAFTKLLL